MGHTIHRTWCGHCMRARGLQERHPALSQEVKDDRGLPIISMDYFWMGRDSKNSDKEPEGELPSLQMKDEHTGLMWSSVVPAKGAEAYAVNFAIRCIEETGYKRVILKSDNENSIKSLKDGIKKGLNGVEAIMEESKTGDSRANGSCEAAVKETKRQVKAMKSALEEKLDTKIGERHPILAWIGRHANFMISRFRVGPDGRTPYERSRGRRWLRPSVVFGERVWFKPLKSYGIGLWEGMKEGLFLGAHGRNGDALLMTTEGVLKGGSLKRMVEEKRWAKDDFDRMMGTPWRMRPQRPEDLDAAVQVELPEVEPGMRLMPAIAGHEAIPRNLYVKRSDVEGQYTPGCEGCNAIQVGLPPRAHSSECRTLVQQRLEQTEEGRLRIEKAKKRKATAPVGADVAQEQADLVVEAVPDPMEEIAAPAIIGQPEDRVEPLVQPGLEGGSSQPIGQAGPQGGRPLDAGRPEEREAKRVKSPTRSRKRGGDDKLQEEMQAEREAAREATASSGSQPSSSARPARSEARAEDISSFLKTRKAEEAEVSEIGQLLLSFGMTKSDVAEIYNPERFLPKANALGLRPGFAIDINLCKNDRGEHWDLSTEKDQRSLKKLLRQRKPLLLIGSPPCGPFSPLQNLNKNRRTEEENEKIRQEGKTHLKVCADSYKEQYHRGRLFLHEHPKPAGSWQEPEIKEVQELPGVFTVQSPMCKWHMVAEDGEGVGYVRKETLWMTNSKILAEALGGQCAGEHRHVHLINGRARQAQVYPPRLVKAILAGVKKELKERGEVCELSELVGAGPSPDDIGNEQEGELYDPDQVPEGEFYDAITGTPLDPKKVLKAREEEMEWVEKQDLWEVVDENMCWEETGKPPITMKWVDRDKGNDNYRSRIVVREVKKASKPLSEAESFSAMPPLEALKTLCSLLTSKKVSRRGLPYKMMLADISRAHFYGLARRRVFCALYPKGTRRLVAVLC